MEQGISFGIAILLTGFILGNVGTNWANELARASPNHLNIVTSLKHREIGQASVLHFIACHEESFTRWPGNAHPHIRDAMPVTVTDVGKNMMVTLIFTWGHLANRPHKIICGSRAVGGGWGW